MPLNRQHLLVRVIDLQCRVRDLEALVQHPLERAADRMTVTQATCLSSGANHKVSADTTSK